MQFKLSKLKLSVLALGLTAVATIAYARPAYEDKINYLDQNGNVIGGKTIYCTGNIWEWGEYNNNVTFEYVYRRTCLGRPGDED